MQARTPLEHTPERPVAHAEPPPGLPSSVCPSQSLSRPSQTSVVAWSVCEQASAPATHVVVPAAQTP
jgi:hypothetical protein